MGFENLDFDCRIREIRAKMDDQKQVKREIERLRGKKGRAVLISVGNQSIQRLKMERDRSTKSNHSSFIARRERERERCSYQIK